MDTVKSLIVILMSSVLVNNYVLSQFLGICPFLGVSKKLNQATGMGIAVTFVMLMATAVTWPIQTFILNNTGLEYMQTIVFILVIAALVQFTEIFLKKYIPALHKSLGVYLPLITTNCAVLGVTINNMTDGFNFIESLVSSLGCGLGLGCGCGLGLGGSIGLTRSGIFGILDSGLPLSGVPLDFRFSGDGCGDMSGFSFGTLSTVGRRIT